MSTYPKMIKVKQNFYTPKLDHPVDEIVKELNRLAISERIKPDAQVAIAVGSRGISNLQVVVKAVVQKVKEQGANPFIVPAMGSHGGATDAGQRGVLASYGITEENVGAPVRSAIEVIEIGRVGDNIPVYFDKLPSQAELLIMSNHIRILKVKLKVALSK